MNSITVFQDSLYILNLSLKLTHFLSIRLSSQLVCILRFCILKILLPQRHFINRVISRRMLLLLLFWMLPVLVNDAVERHRVVVIDVGAERHCGGGWLDVISVSVVRTLVIAEWIWWIYKVSAMTVWEVVLLKIILKIYTWTTY